ncbi:SusC/RagA family TonB-linked outer membrane protein [Puia sp.]|uniref:SusC/RagA family TonB-linked outer membrane protein n=1 Tax=Puia sp. TaxID=2045100 RepID=UPI002F3EA425
MKRRLLLLSLLTFFLGGSVLSQQGPVVISGVITASAGTPLAGANVAIKGESKGVITDDQGKFSLSARPGAILVVSHIGYHTKEIHTTGKTFITEALTISGQEMENAVVIGYQTASRKSVSTSIASVSAKDIESYTTGNVGNALEGKVPGLQVVSGGGLPGAQPKILIHGLSSINYNNNPLIIVDGVESEFNDLNFINPSDIATIDVLEDASAAAIYGARGGQGVIVVTTKRGKGAPTINVAGTYGINKLPRIRLAGAQEYAGVMNQEAAVSGQRTLPFPDPSKLTSADYWKNTFDDGHTQNYVVSATGGHNGTSLYGSFGYYREDAYNATSLGGNWQKYTARLNADMELNKAVKIGFSVAPRYETWLSSPNNTYAAYSMDPTVLPFKSQDSVRKSIPNGFMDMTAFNPLYSTPNRSTYNSITNPAFNYLTNFGKNDYFGSQYAAYLQVAPVKGLVLKTAIEGFVNVGQYNNYVPKYYLASNGYNVNAQLSSQTTLYTRWKITNTANYKITVKDHSFDLLAGQSTDKYFVKATSAARQGPTAIPLDDPSFQYISAATGTITGGGGSYQPGATPWGNMVSYFGSLRYNYKQKYYLAGTMRADASSLVNPLYRWGYFPTVSGAWIVSEEPFFGKLADKAINYLKLRASWGKSGGNLPPASGAYLTVLGATTYPNATGGYIQGYAPATIANPEIRWEIQKDYTFGLEARALNNKLDITAEKFIRNPSNLLENITVDYILGYPQGYYPTQLANIGKMTTNGWDLSIGYKDNITRKLRFSANLTVSHSKSIVKDLGTADPILGHEANDAISTFRSRLTKGHEPGAWYGYVTDGVFQSDAEAAAYVNKNGTRLQPTAKAGDLKFRNTNGDSVLDSKDFSDLGSPWPKFTGNLTLTFNYGNFDLRAEFYGSFGAEYFQSYRLNMNPNSHLNFKSGFADQFWHGPGTSNKFPVLRYPDQNGNFSKMSGFFLAKADFVKCNLLQFGYTIPKWIRGVQNLRIFVAAQNLFAVTKYPGLNPDLPWYNNVGYNGVDNYQALPSRVFLVGLNLNL